MHIGLTLHLGYIWFSVMCILAYRGINVCVYIYEYHIYLNLTKNIL